RVRGGAPPARRVECAQEVADLGHALLEQIADGTRLVREQLGRVPLLHVLREPERGRAGPAPADLDRRAQALVGERRRHPDVDDADVRPLAFDGLDQAERVLHRADDLMPLVAEQAAEPLAEQDAVLGDHDTHGISTIRTVGPPSGESRCSSPSSAPTRSRRPASPEPSSIDAPPTPSSWTWVVSQPSSARRTVTFALVAFECFATLARASDTTKYAAASVEAGGRFAISTLTSTGTGDRAASAESAAASPRSGTTAGGVPRGRPGPGPRGPRAVRRAPDR